MNSVDVNQAIKNYCVKINEELIKCLPNAEDGQAQVVRAMKYSLSNGGKRLRPILVLEFCKMCGGNVEDAMAYACAIEYIHTYSLIHDDLPCMDNDDMRRGNPSCHKMFGEATALLAGDALLTHAFEIAAGANLSASQNAKAVSLIAQNAGVRGMIGGQVIDLKYESQDPSVADILTVHKLKTGALISTACILGCIAANATDEQIASASKYAYCLGIAFQIKDDLLDIFGSEEKLGKPIGSDAENEKTTYVTLVGAEKSQRDVEMLTQNAVKQLNCFKDKEFVVALSEYLTTREK
ncbi:MAG: polyprenyl synthetase family protein [Eubacterium sp.]